jgi:misacylated tRNA(Ala) deacylase
MVIIDGIDRTPCCGTHLPTLSTLQLFLFPSLTSTSSTSFRHYFLACPCLLNHLGSAQALLTRTAGVFSCGAPETPERVTLLVDERSGGRSASRISILECELAGSLGRQLRIAVLNALAYDDTSHAPGFYCFTLRARINKPP